MSKKKTIFQLLTEKPWEQDQIEADNEHQGQTVNVTKQKLKTTSRSKRKYQIAITTIGKSPKKNLGGLKVKISLNKMFKIDRFY